MDITSFIVQGRDQALLYGDYSTYHSQLTKRLLNSRKKIGIATRNRGKFQNKGPVTPDNIAANVEYVHLALLSSERGWAQAMSFKASHTADQKGIAGRSRSHIISRLDKAARNADTLVEALEQAGNSIATTTDVLEAKAYAAMLRGATQFEKHAWGPCLQSYSIARIIYSALATAVKGDIFKDLLSETIDPSIRYAAYQLKTSRTIPIPIIARKAFPQSDSTLVGEISKINPDILKQGDPDSVKNIPDVEGAPRTLAWRSREVKIEDAQIAVAWGSVQGAKGRLAERLPTLSNRGPYEVAGAYDEVLTATQDTVDATKQAIDELKAEGVGQGDSRMQSLQITRTAVNYEMISWRIGRNRVLTGPHDGATEEYGSSRRKRTKGKTGEPVEQHGRDLPVSRKLAKLKENVALYDGTLQNLQSIKELPGVAADESLATRIDAVVKYFQALKTLSIARSHAIIGNFTNALGLINHSSSLCRDAAAILADVTVASGPVNADVSSEAVEFLGNLLNGELQRHRALVHIDNLHKEAIDNVSTTGRTKASPLVEHLQDYPTGGADLDNIVEFPPKMSLIPVNPIILDVAWNYIKYPGQSSTAGDAPPAKTSGSEPKQEEPQKQQKRGWFGFGRS